ncbi:MAG: hypothetical protein K2X86_11270 [Cytophagaceae bacterium]|nr:hypothetical protein [Cytophagaceae bacterium]
MKHILKIFFLLILFFPFFSSAQETSLELGIIGSPIRYELCKECKNKFNYSTALMLSQHINWFNIRVGIGIESKSYIRKNFEPDIDKEIFYNRYLTFPILLGIKCFEKNKFKIFVSGGFVLQYGRRKGRLAFYKDESIFKGYPALGPHSYDDFIYDRTSLQASVILKYFLSGKFNIMLEAFTRKSRSNEFWGEGERANFLFTGVNYVF